MNMQRYPFIPADFKGIDFAALRAAQQAHNEELKSRAEQEAHDLKQKQDAEEKYFRAYFLDLGIGFDEVIFDGGDVDSPWGRVSDLWLQPGNCSARIVQGERHRSNGYWFSLPGGAKLPSEWHPIVRRDVMAAIVSILDQLNPQQAPEEAPPVPFMPCWYGAIREIPDDDDDDFFADDGRDENDNPRHDYMDDEEYEEALKNELPSELTPPQESCIPAFSKTDAANRNANLRFGDLNPPTPDWDPDENEETAWANNYLSQYGFTISSQQGGSDV